MVRVSKLQRTKVVSYFVCFATLLALLMIKFQEARHCGELMLERLPQMADYHWKRPVFDVQVEDVRDLVREGRLRLMQIYHGSFGFPTAYFLQGSLVEVQALDWSEGSLEAKVSAFDADGDGELSYSEAARLCDSLKNIITVPYFVGGELTDKYFRRECYCEEEDASPITIVIEMASVITMMDSEPASKATIEVKDFEWTGKLTDVSVETIARQLASVDVPVVARDPQNKQG